MTTARELAEALRGKLPEHTFKAVIFRAKALDPGEERCALLSRILAERERGEAFDARGVAS